MKKCSICGVVKPSSEYYKHKSKPYGVRSECRECTKKMPRRPRDISKTRVQNRRYEKKSSATLSDAYIRKVIWRDKSGAIKFADITADMIADRRNALMKHRIAREASKEKRIFVPLQPKYCKICGREIHKRRFYCSDKCGREKERRRYRDNAELINKRLRESYLPKPKSKCECKICGRTFESNKRAAAYCSHACRQKAESIVKKIRNRLREKRLLDNSMVIELITVEYLHQRDGGKCQICKRKVNMDLKHPHPMSASIDHIIPISKGGEHTKKNTRLAHMICNSRRQHHYDRDQLRLFG